MSDIEDEENTFDADKEAYVEEEIDLERAYEEELRQLEDQRGPPEDADRGAPKADVDLRMNKPPEAMKVRGDAHNTGVKGVKADYEEAKKNMMTQRFREQLRYQRELKRRAEGKGAIDIKALEEAERKAREAEKPKLKVPEPKRKARSLSESEEDSEFDSEFDEEDEEALAEYTRKRLADLQLLRNSLPTYSTYDRVSFAELQKTVKETHELVPILVHVYENDVEACARLHIALEELAPQLPHVRLLRIRASEAFPSKERTSGGLPVHREAGSYSKAGLPTLLVFRDGKMVHSVICPVEEDFPKGDAQSEPKEVAKYLVKLGVVRSDPVSAALEAARAKQTQSSSSNVGAPGVRKAASNTASVLDDDE